jgi:preprotein translocase subunit Sss1
MDDITPETIPVKKIGAGILALGAIGVLLALKYNKK